MVDDQISLYCSNKDLQNMSSIQSTQNGTLRYLQPLHRSIRPSLRFSGKLCREKELYLFLRVSSPHLCGYCISDCADYHCPSLWEVENIGERLFSDESGSNGVQCAVQPLCVLSFILPSISDQQQCNHLRMPEEELSPDNWKKVQATLPLELVWLALPWFYGSKIIGSRVGSIWASV